ncbi:MULTISPECIES: contractile injection system protein, VgrG/Pvc8 family [Paenibacillus]|uniref:contractile injection system protein, VgrG/Pvc8 family n=1 Tax=Paenibacillus TaxID=44249 RepID=UPI00096C425A|nr:contractile injection system protein, VgrG/Pvc8 family [Paenibacillus borealis]
MSLLSAGIGYESLRFEGPFQPQLIERLQITRMINDHAYLQISGVLPEEQGAKCIGKTMDQEPIVIHQLDEQGQSVRRLFHGIVMRLSVHCTRGVYMFELEAASHSYQMDSKVKKRSYQDIHRTYDDLVTTLVRKYRYGDAIDTVSNHTKLDAFVLQYEETDWAFLKRLASRFGSVLVPEVTAASPKLFFGLPEGKMHKVERAGSYRVRKTFHELDTGQPGEHAGPYVTYRIESLQYYALGDRLTLPVGPRKELAVVSAVTRLEDGLLRTRYDLQPEQDIRYARYGNDKAVGIMLTGKVLKVQQDYVQLQLDMDPQQDPAKACWFPVATRYVAEGHTGWYNMPEIGEQVELYLPTNREQEAYVTGSLRQHRNTNGQPDVKMWRHAQGSGVEMSGQELTLSTSGECSITLHEAGITVSSPGNVLIQGANIKLDAGEELSLQAGTALYLKGGASSMILDGETDIQAPVIDQEGTVKAPVFVADLPPVPEPPLMSIQAYEAAQAAAQASSSSPAEAPAAKITSPAAQQQAEALLGTVSKLLGAIPAVARVAGVFLNAFGGPAGKAAGMIMQATAAVPVRSTGTSRAGGGAAGGGLHPLKYLASLALEGLISQYELEQRKQDYYSKWILGNVFTSARQLAHSGGPLELVQNLLAESKAMYLAYHQVPADLRQRWWGNYESYLAQQPQPETEKPKPKSWWGKMFEQYGENEILTAEAKRESAQLQMELAWDAAQGANETIRVNQSLGLYKQRDYHPNHPIAGKVGEIAGDVVSSLQGIGEFIVGAGGELFSVAVSSTGVLTPFGVLTGVASTGLISHGGVLAYNGASNLGESSAELWQMMKGEGKPPKSSSAKPEKPGHAEGKGESTESPALKDSPYHPDSVAERTKPPYKANPAHDKGSPYYNPKKTPEPADSVEIYNKSVRGGMGTWYGVNKDGKIYQYFSDNARGVHFAGEITKDKLTKSVRQQLGIK